MITLLLISQTDNGLRPHLENSGFRVIEYIYPMSGVDLENLYRTSGWDYCISELSGRDSPIMDTIISRMKKKGRVLILSDSLDDDRSSKFFNLGITDVFQKNERDELIGFMHAERQDRESNGTIVVYDDSPVISGMVYSVISRFSYVPVVAGNREDFFRALNSPEVQFILINLDTADLEVGRIIQCSRDVPNLRRNPVILYTGSSSGPGISDLMSGLNRLSSFILTPEELLSFLVDLLYKMEIMPLVEETARLVRFESNECCVRDPLRLVYFTKMESIFDCENLLGCSDYRALKGVVRKISEVMDRVHGIRWLRKESSCADDFNTAERAV